MRADAVSGAAVLRLALDNPCEVEPSGTSVRRSDTIHVEITGFDRATDCPAQYRPECWHARLPPLGAGAYVVRVMFNGPGGHRWLAYEGPLRL